MEQPNEATSEVATPLDEVTKEPAGPRSLPTDFALRWEVVAVFFVAVFPTLSWNFLSYYLPQTIDWEEQIPYAIYALYSCSRKVCIIIPVLFLIWRSGESWASFGLVRPRRGDIAMAFAILVAHVLVIELVLIWRLFDGAPYYPRPHQEAEYVLMILMYVLGAFSEELVYRSYLMTRFRKLFRSSAPALGVSIVLFSLLHKYPSNMWSAALSGLVYGIAFLCAGRIWPVAIAHFLYNMTIELQILP